MAYLNKGKKRMQGNNKHRKDVGKVWQERRKRINELPSPLTKQQRTLLINIDKERVEESYNSRSYCVKVGGVWRQVWQE